MASDDVFLSRVTHDLRGELATMVAGIHYLLRYENGLGTAGRQMLDRVNGAGQRLRRLLDELELSAWIEGAPANAPLQPEPCRPEMLVHASLGRLEKAIAQRRVAVDVDLPPELPEVVADPELLGVAVEYALDFAVARSPDKTVHVTGSAGRGGPVIRIADAGGAVDAAALAHIFDPFVEKDLVPRPEPGARRRERLGLGLAIARGILAAQGGALDASITPEGDGILLTLSLGSSGCRAAVAV